MYQLFEVFTLIGNTMYSTMHTVFSLFQFSYIVHYIINAIVQCILSIVSGLSVPSMSCLHCQLFVANLSKFILNNKQQLFSIINVSKVQMRTYK